MCDLEFMSRKLKVLKEQNLWMLQWISEELLTHKSIFTCKITLSCSFSKNWWKSVQLLEIYLHPSCYFLTPQLILSLVFLCNIFLPINTALFTFFKWSSSVCHYQVTKLILILHYLSKRWCWGALRTGKFGKFCQQAPSGHWDVTWQLLNWHSNSTQSWQQQ